jgi:hypothetical protein
MANKILALGEAWSTLNRAWCSSNSNGPIQDKLQRIKDYIRSQQHEAMAELESE